MKMEAVSVGEWDDQKGEGRKIELKKKTYMTVWESEKEGFVRIQKERNA